VSAADRVRPTAPVPLHRLHPLTPLLRGVKVFTAVLALLSYQTVQQVGVGAVLAAIPALVLLGSGWALLSWRFTGYRVVNRELHVETGILFRRSRRVPLERLQAVDVVRPLVGRVLGLAELRLEVVGQGRTEAPLAYLAEAEAQRLRDRLLALAAGVDEHAPAPDERILARVPVGDLVGSVLLLGPVVLLVPAAVVAGGTLLAWDRRAFLGFLAPLLSMLWAGGQVAVRRLLTEYDFTVAESPDGLRLRHGLLETRAQTVPPGRVQAVRVEQPLLWRLPGWVRVEVDVAGYDTARHRQQEATRALLPVAPQPFALALVHRVVPGLDLAAAPFAGAPPRARWRAPVQWRQLGIAVCGGVAVVRRGRLRRTLTVVPLAKAQSVRRTQGSWQRRLDLATVHLDTAGRHLRAAAQHRDAAEADALVAGLAALARAERDRRRPAQPPPRSEPPLCEPPRSEPPRTEPPRAS